MLHKQYISIALITLCTFNLTGMEQTVIKKSEDLPVKTCIFHNCFTSYYPNIEKFEYISADLTKHCNRLQQIAKDIMTIELAFDAIRIAIKEDIFATYQNDPLPVFLPHNKMLIEKLMPR